MADHSDRAFDSIVSDALRAGYAGESLVSTHSFAVMGTTANTVLVGGTDDMNRELESLTREIERLWTRFSRDSDIQRLNWAEGEATTVSPLTVTLVMEMLAAMSLTNGEYDPTILPRLLAEGYETSRVDSSRVTQLPVSATWPIDVSAATISGTTITLPRGATLDPGGVGKGLAADILAARALELGALGALIEIGGDVRIVGTPPDNFRWRIGIENPFVAGEHSAVVNLVDGAVATSSVLKRTWTKDDEQRHHLIDPSTGESMKSDVVSVSVIAVSASIAEVVAKCGFIRADFLTWAPTLGTAALLMFRDGSRAETANWKDYS